LNFAKMDERSEASRQKYFFNILTQSFALRFKLRFAQPFLAKFKLATNWSVSPQGLSVPSIFKQTARDLHDFMFPNKKVFFSEGSSKQPETRRRGISSSASNNFFRKLNAPPPFGAYRSNNYLPHLWPLEHIRVVSIAN